MYYSENVKKGVSIQLKTWVNATSNRGKMMMMMPMLMMMMPNLFFKFFQGKPLNFLFLKSWAICLGYHSHWFPNLVYEKWSSLSKLKFGVQPGFGHRFVDRNVLVDFGVYRTKNGVYDNFLEIPICIVSLPKISEFVFV